ncbi:helix-turn-helix domain-containing protein [Adlercreutzia shanghongiae]|uniref:helix-turn-helix domain-containing protein n=1 Tax=Adlercreutzia shanghongiae TaxID=3111773 RepID=UPI003743CC29
MGETQQIIGGRVRAVRESKGLTQEQLSLMVGVSRMSIWRLENDSENVSVACLDKLLDGLGCTIIELLRDDYLEVIVGEKR